MERDEITNCSRSRRAGWGKRKARYQQRDRGASRRDFFKTPGRVRGRKDRGKYSPISSSQRRESCNHWSWKEEEAKAEAVSVEGRRGRKRRGKKNERVKHHTDDQDRSESSGDIVALGDGSDESEERSHDLGEKEEKVR